MANPRLTGAMKRLELARARRRRQQLGPVLHLDDATLDALSTVGPEALPLAEALIRDAAGAAGVAMFRATRGAP